MRKLFWIFAFFMVLAAIGNFIGGTDTPATGSVPKASFSDHMYVNASGLNLRVEPSTNAQVVKLLPRNTRVTVGEWRSGWVRVSVDGHSGWVSEAYLARAPSSSAAQQPIVSQTRQPAAQTGQETCPPRRYCTQIGSCAEAVFYYRNCSWGGALDGDKDGIPCEKLCQ